jgi:hypothetical protein
MSDSFQEFIFPLSVQNFHIGGLFSSNAGLQISPVMVNNFEIACHELAIPQLPIPSVRASNHVIFCQVSSDIISPSLVCT